MSIREELKSILALNAMTITKLADLANEKDKVKYTPQSISEKLSRGTIKYEEVRFLLDILGYDIKFVRRK